MTELEAVEWYVKERLLSEKPIDQKRAYSCNSLLDAAILFRLEASRGNVPAVVLDAFCRWTRETLGRMAPVIDRVDKLFCSQPARYADALPF